MTDEKGELVLDIDKIEGSLKNGFNSVKNFFKTSKIVHNKFILPIILILFVILLSTFIRWHTITLPVTDTWAESSVYSEIKANILSDVTKQNPNLPDSMKQSYVTDQFNQLLKANKDQIQPMIDQRSKYFRQQLQDSNNETFIPDIDPYLWFGYAKNYLECGHLGCQVIKEDYMNYRADKPTLIKAGTYVTLRNGRFGIPNENMNLVSTIGIIIYKIMNVFRETSLKFAFFMIPLLLIGLSIIPAFMIGKKFGGNIGGFFSAVFIVTNIPLLGRSIAGGADTDSSNIVFPLFIMWFFIEAFDSKNYKLATIYGILGAITFYIYSRIWFPEYIFDFMIVSLVLFIIYILSKQYMQEKSFKALSLAPIKGQLTKVGIFLGLGILSLIFANSLRFFETMFTSIIGFIFMKNVAVSTLWPNVLTTVAEFNEVPFSNIINQMGGPFFFIIAVLGIILLAIRRKSEEESDTSNHIFFSIFLAIWFVGTAYSFTQGLRFALLLVPPFACALGAGVGIIYSFIVKWIASYNMNVTLVKIVLFLVFCTLLISPISAANKVAMNEIPMYNSAWDQSLDKIMNDAPDHIGYITTWWDYGHYFVAKGVRVTMDGGDQNSLHYGGKVFVVSDEDTAIGILRMLNCGQNFAPRYLEDLFGNRSNYSGEHDTVKAIDVVNRIILQDKKGAEQILRQEGLNDQEIANVLKLTHCDDLLPHYVIASEDMIGKSGVWAHFGLWNFTKAKIWQTVKGMNYDEGINILQQEFNISREKAPGMYTEIQQTAADTWISPWPGYYSQLASCTSVDNLLRCQNGVEIDLTTMAASVYTQQGKTSLSSLAYIDENGEFKVKTFTGTKVSQSALLLPNNTTMFVDPLQAGSMFTRMFFYNGLGLKHFKLLSEMQQVTGEAIQVWKVNYDTQYDNVNNTIVEGNA